MTLREDLLSPSLGCGVAVHLLRYPADSSAAAVIVRLPDTSQLAIPEWMFEARVYEDLRV
jgi:hypothetical protein